METIHTARLWAIKKLTSAHIDSPHLDAEALLAYTLNNTREYILAHPEKKLSTQTIKKFKQLLLRRTRHEPLAYIIGTKEFFSLPLYVNRSVLIPRPETELLVQLGREEFLSLYHNQTPALVIEMGTGSGCISIALAKQLKNFKQRVSFFGIDNSSAALAIAKKNARTHGVGQIRFLRGNLLAPLISFLKGKPGRHVIMLANLPYLTAQELKTAQPEIKRYEPKHALFGGHNGLMYYKKLLRQIYDVAKSNPTSYTCFFEINPKQKKPLERLVNKQFNGNAAVSFFKDLSGNTRVCRADI